MTYTALTWATQASINFDAQYAMSLLELGGSDVTSTCIVQPDINDVGDPVNWECYSDDSLTLDAMSISPSAGCTTDTITYSY